MPAKAKPKYQWGWLRFRVDREVRKRFRLACVKEEMSMSEALAAYMEQFAVRSEEKENQRKEKL